MTGVSSIFSYLGIFCNFNKIFNLVVGPICRRNLHRQPLHHLTRLVEMPLMIELDFEINVFSVELRSFEKPYVALLNLANTAYKQSLCLRLSVLPRTCGTSKSHLICQLTLSCTAICVAPSFNAAAIAGVFKCTPHPPGGDITNGHCPLSFGSRPPTHVRMHCHIVLFAFADKGRTRKNKTEERKPRDDGGTCNVEPQNLSVKCSLFRVLEVHLDQIELLSIHGKQILGK